MGQVLAPFGVRGWVKVRPYTETIDSLLGHREWWLAPANSDPLASGLWQRRELLDGEAHHEHLAAALSEVPDREAAQRLRGYLIAVPRHALGESDADAYLWADLEGLAVVNRKDEALGVVSGLMETGAHDLLRIQGEDGRERLVPFVAAYVLDVDLPNRRIVVDWELDY